MDSDNLQLKLRIQTKIEQVFAEKEIKLRFKDWKFEDFTHEFIFTTKDLFDFLGKNNEQILFISLLKETLENPYEIWQQFQQNTVSGRVRLQYKFIKAFALKNEEVGIAAIFEANEGTIQFKEFFVVREPNLHDQINHFRSGKLIFKRNEPRLGS